MELVSPDPVTLRDNTVKLASAPPHQLSQQRAEILYHSAGYNTIINVVLQDAHSDKTCPEINFKQMLKSVGITKDSNGTYQRRFVQSSTSALGMPIMESSPEFSKKGRVEYGFVTGLESKYSKSFTVCTSPMSDGFTPATNDGGKKKKRLADHRDFYETTDGFVDDDELIQDYDNEAKKKSTKTVHRYHH